MAATAHAPPQNIEAEASVLGAMLVAEPALTRVIDEVRLNAEDFYLEKHAVIFEAIHDLYAASKPVDELTVRAALTQGKRLDAAGGKHYISELAAKVPAAGNAKHYAEIVQDKAIERAKREIGYGLIDGLARAEAIERLRLLESQAGGTAGRRLIGYPMSEVEPSRTRWAWAGRLPLGAVALLAGRQGLGKSTLLASIAADLSRGRLPGDLAGEPATVLMVSYEDVYAATVVPRLIAADADLTRVIGLDLTEDGRPDLLSLPGDLDLVAAAAREHGARVLALDPLMAALPGRIDSHRDQDVRRALAPLGQLAEDADLAIVAVLHLRKGAATEALDRVSGSVAFTAAARSVLAFGRGEEDDGASEAGRVLAHAKSNLGPLAASLAYRLEPVTVHHGSTDIPTSRLACDGECEVGAGELLSPPAAEDRTEVEIAAEWLADELADGEWRPAAEVRETAKRGDIASRTLQRAAARLGVEDKRDGFPARGLWRLPHSRATGVGATGNGATGATSADGSTEPKVEGSGPQSRQGAYVGATEASETPITPEEIAAAEAHMRERGYAS